jgi:glutamate synthase (NADPH/NADH) small chain
MKKEMKPRLAMPHQPAEERVQNFTEVALGYTQDNALEEAGRCLQCKARPCVKGCPVNIDIPEFVKMVAEGRFSEAASLVKKANSLPAICGRVCPQEEQCEQVCVLNKLGQPVAIGRLERFVADYQAANSNGKSSQGAVPPPTDVSQYSVAVVGSGPAGLTVAGELAKMGYSVTIFEALHKPGGVLRYGIPEFRLPRDILDREIDFVKSLGVRLLTNIVIGKTITIDQLLENGFEAVFVGSGAGAPAMMNIPGENLNGVLSANEFLTRVNLMRANRFPEYATPVRVPTKAAVIGAGNVAMDAARTSLRIGAKEVSIVYRRSRTEMPARAEEIENAIEEGVQLHLLTNPTRFIGNERGWLTGMECIQMELGEPDSSGRRRPIPVRDSEFVLEVDTAIVAIGQTPNPLIRMTTPGLKTQSWGGIITDPATGATSVPGVYSGGDAVTGAATVITAMGAGKAAAEGIDKYIREKHGL